LRSEVARRPNNTAVYEDFLNAMRSTPPGWTMSVATFGLRNLGERLAAGERPTLAELATSIARIYSGLAEGYKKVGVSDRANLDALAAPVLAALQ
jgi:hypothetical protein